MQGKCQGHVRWAPQKGYVPRGYRGATGRLDEVELVLVCAEPGDAYEGEPYDGPTALDKLRSAYTHSCWHIQNPRDSFGRNMREILNIAFPTLCVAEQLRRTWITNAVLCSARKECGPVSVDVEQECRDRYLLAQLQLFPNAKIVALGDKAEKRLRGVPRVKSACHPASRLSHHQMRESWERALEGLGHSKLQGAAATVVAQPLAVRAADGIHTPSLPPVSHRRMESHLQWAQFWRRDRVHRARVERFAAHGRRDCGDCQPHLRKARVC